MNHNTETRRAAPYRHLRHRITAFCALLTGLVLLAACGISFQAARREMRSAAQSLFLSQCQTVSAYLAAPGSVDTQTLLRFAEQYDLAIAVVDGGTLLDFAPGLSAETWQTLLTEAQKTDVGQQLYASTAQSGSFTLTAAGQRWHASLQHQSASTTRWYNILVLQPLRGDTAATLRLAVLYGLVFCAGWAALIAASAWLARQAVRPVEQAQNEQLRFLAGASHELKTPLAVISTSAELLRRGTASPEEPCRTIERETRQMARLIDDMLVLTNSGTGRWTLQTRSLSPEDAAMAVYERFAPVFARDNRDLTLDLPDTALPPVLADAQRLEQILSILLDNAHAYAPGPVTLQVDRLGDTVRFWVRDHGPGIPDAEKPEIFRFFYRRSAPAGDASRHYGLGLSVAYELARLHQGTLTVGDTPGGGASFCLSLAGRPESSR